MFYPSMSFSYSKKNSTALACVLFCLLTFGDDRGQKASWRTWTKSAKQGATDHRWFSVGASVHPWVSGNKIGGFLCNIWTRAAPYNHLDLVHI